MKNKKLLLLTLFSALTAVVGYAENALPSSDTYNIKKIASGVWHMKAGTPELFNLFTDLDVKPKFDAINKMQKAEDFPFTKEEMDATLFDRKTYLRFPLADDEKIFGLGLEQFILEKRQNVFHMHIDHFKGMGRTQAPVPFLVSTKGYGIFINSARYLSFYVGTGHRHGDRSIPLAKNRNDGGGWRADNPSQNLEILIPAEGVDVYIFKGKDMLDVVRRWNLFSGGGTMPPQWGLGMWYRPHTKYSSATIEEKIQEFKKRDFPVNVVGLEPGWQSNAYPCTYEWDSKRYPDPKSFVSNLNNDNVKVNLWINAGISTKSSLYKQILPYTCSHNLWLGAIPDYHLPKARKIVQDFLKKDKVDLGVSGFKMDENDGNDRWLFPDVAQFPSKIPAEQQRQTLGPIMQKTIYDIFKEKNQRTYGLVRAGNAGTTSLPFALYNDSYNHRSFVIGLINSTFVGVQWTPEVRISDDKEEWVRRWQTVAYSPMMLLNAWAWHVLPWQYEEVADIVKDTVVTRMKLIPYMYTAYAEYNQKGTPPIRAMNLENAYKAKYTPVVYTNKLTNKNPYEEAIKKEVKDQYMFGPDMLIAPFFAGEKITERKVILPEGKWYDFYTGKLAGENEILTVKSDLKTIPIFVRDGAIIPMYKEVPKFDGKKIAVEVRHYGQKPSTYKLYDDDGTTFNYEKGDYTFIDIAVKVDENGHKKGFVKKPDNKKLWHFNGEFEFKFMTK